MDGAKAKYTIEWHRRLTTPNTRLCVKFHELVLKLLWYFYACFGNKEQKATRGLCVAKVGAKRPLQMTLFLLLLEAFDLISKSKCLKFYTTKVLMNVEKQELRRGYL